MKQCDLYVQPSKDEAYCTTTNEARILGKTIVTTNCSGMDEQIIDGITGFILKNDVNELFEKIKFLINNVSVLNDLDNNVQLLNLDLSEYFNDYKKELFV